jgi:hypothetical protein
LEKYLERGEETSAKGYLLEVEKNVNCCVKRKALTTYIDALYRGGGQNYSTPEKCRKQTETSKDKQDEDKQRQRNEKEVYRTKDKQEPRQIT